MYYCLISGRHTCYSGWKAEYPGFHMTEEKNHNNNKDYVCMEKNAGPIDTNGALFHAVRTTCGSLRCPPYKNHTEMLCVVCTTSMCYLHINKTLIELALFTLQQAKISQ